MAKPIFLVCGCQKYKEYLLAAINRFSRPSWIIIGVVGDPTYTSSSFDGQILTAPVSDVYEALPSKIYAAMKWIHENYPNAPGIYKTDDDIVYHDMNQLEHELIVHMDKPFWGLHITSCSSNYIIQLHKFNDKSLRPTHQGATYCYGHGYWINRTALPAIIEAENDYTTSYLEDVCTGFVMNRAGYIPTHIPIPYTEYPRGPELLVAK